MTPPLYEVVIVAAPKDYNKLPYVVQGAWQKLVPKPAKVRVITPDGIKGEGWVAHTDNGVLPYDRSKFRYRPNWIYQQFLKLFQDVSSTDWYIVLDADLIVMRPLEVFRGNQGVFFVADKRMHEPYFTYGEKMIGVGKVFEWSFIADFMLYNKDIILEMLQSTGLDLWEFLDKSAEIIEYGCCPAEQELYGSYVTANHPDSYVIQGLRHCVSGKQDGAKWTQQEIDMVIRYAAHDDVDVLSIHSWEG